MKQRKNKCIGPLCAGYLALALVATAAEQSLPTPPPSEFVDMESSTTVPIPTDQGRRIKLTLDFESTPSNAVQVAFGRDLNADDDLAPEETEVVVGCDCGGAVVRDEVKVEGEGVAAKVEGEGEQWNCDHHCSPSPLTFTLKQPKADRWTHAKVTTHNLADTNLTVTAEFYAKGNLLILR